MMLLVESYYQLTTKTDYKTNIKARRSVVSVSNRKRKQIKWQKRKSKIEDSKKSDMSWNKRYSSKNID